MLDPSNVPGVDSDESLARFVFSKSHFSRENGRVKAAAFMPAPGGELSVNRRRDSTEDEIWRVGRAIAQARNVTLYAPGDVLAGTFASQKLSVLAAPIQDNPNHANVVGWPMDDKAKLKLIAEEIAVVARFVPSPNHDNGKVTG